MSKLFKLRDYLLLIAAVSADALSDFKGGVGMMPGAMKEMYGFVPDKWKTTSYTSEVSRMLATDDIERVEIKGKVYLELTSKGKKEFKRRFPLLSLQKKWDGNFMTVIFDIPEKFKKVRDGLRLKLEELSFGMLQKSVWISPYHFEEDLKEFLENNRLGSYVLVLTTKKLYSDDPRKLAENVWNLKKINMGYSKLL